MTRLQLLQVLLLAVAGLSAVFPSSALAQQTQDWLRTPVQAAATVVQPDATTIVLGNSLLTRTFTTTPAFGTVNLEVNATLAHGGRRSLLRAFKPEGYVTLDNTTYALGGLTQNSTFLAYLNRTAPSMAALPAGLFSTPTQVLGYVNHTVSAPTAPYPWTPGTRHSLPLAWPPKGTVLVVELAAPASAPAAHQALRFRLYYQLLDGAPAMAKWLQIDARPGATGVADVVVRHIDVELLAVNAGFGAYLTHGALAPDSIAFGSTAQGSSSPIPMLDADTDQAHGTQCLWLDDYPNSSSSVPGLKDQGATEPYLNCTYTSGPGAHVSSTESFVSFRALTLALEANDPQRVALARQRLIQLLAPDVTENPIFFHATDVSEIGFKTAIDQMASVGMEMLIYSFGSGFQLETSDPLYLAKIKGQIDYAKSKGIEVGGYDLICLDRGHGGYGGNVGDQWDAVDASGQLGADACFASGWVDKLTGLVHNFVNKTGLSMLETDGPYGGGSCASTKHAHHDGLEDSIYRQTMMQNEFYAMARELGLYVNQPDNYFFNGGQKTGMGYDENQFSLPRIQDLSISRMGLTDDLLGAHLPTMGWFFVPLVQYHAGGSAATFFDHLEEFEWALAQYLGAGVAACYRGNKLYDSPQGQALVAKWVGVYKSHRNTLIQPIVRLRRADMQGWDGFLHVNPLRYGWNGTGPAEIGFAMLFNPTDASLTESIYLPLYYCGADDKVLVSINDGPTAAMAVARDYSVVLPNLAMPPRSIFRVAIYAD